VHHAVAHRHGIWTHQHHHRGPHRHARLPFRSAAVPHARHHDHGPDGERRHGHRHGLVDPEIVRSRSGARTVGLTLAILAAAVALQAGVFILSGSVALLSDLIHNAGDALTAVPLGVAFLATSRRGEHWAGYAIVLAVLVSAAVAATEALRRLLHPMALDHLAALALAGLIGFVANEVAAEVRLRAARRLGSAALLADGHHARVDGFVSLGVVVSALGVALGVEIADPLVSLAITALILRITWQAWSTIRADTAT